MNGAGSKRKIYLLEKAAMLQRYSLVQLTSLWRWVVYLEITVFNFHIVLSDGLVNLVQHGKSDVVSLI